MKNNDNHEYQVTLKCADNKYKPVSCIVANKKIDLLKSEEKREVINRGIKKICAQKYWTSADLKKYNYTKVLIREYIRKDSIR